jgi:hypothetical protein
MRVLNRRELFSGKQLPREEPNENGHHSRECLAPLLCCGFCSGGFLKQALCPSSFLHSCGVTLPASRQETAATHDRADGLIDLLGRCYRAVCQK